VQPGGCLRGTLRVPGDKSISHRALMLAAVAEGETRIRGLLPGADVVATRRALQAAGVDIREEPGGETVVAGRGAGALRAPREPLDVGNSGTSMRLLAGLFAGLGLPVTLVGDASLMRRPMQRVVAPLAAMGARVQCGADGRPPLRVQAHAGLHGIDYTVPVASAQVKSAILLAGLFASGSTRVVEPAPTRDHTERMLRHFGARVQDAGPDGIRIDGGTRLVGQPVQVPGDISSAAFFMVGAAIAAGSAVRLEQVGINPTRTGVIDVLRAMGAMVELHEPRSVGDEPVADVLVQGSPLRGIEVPAALVPRAIDEFPALLVAAACAAGTTRIRGAAELRVKESDRIDGMAAGLAALGIQAEPVADGIDVHGGALRGGVVDSRGDHRLAMAFAMAGLRAGALVRIRDCDNVATSFPDFVPAAAALGLAIRVAGG